MELDSLTAVEFESGKFRTNKLFERVKLHRNGHPALLTLKTFLTSLTNKVYILFWAVERDANSYLPRI